MFLTFRESLMLSASLFGDLRWVPSSPVLSQHFFPAPGLPKLSVCIILSTQMPPSMRNQAGSWGVLGLGHWLGGRWRGNAVILSLDPSGSRQTALQGRQVLAGGAGASP